MLVISTSSSCDVCLESYDSLINIPSAISCGHVFCQKCLDQLARTSCPLCRVPFDPAETRRLHIDLGTPPRLTHAHVSSDPDEPPLPPPSVAPFHHERQRLQSDIIRVVRDGVKSSELRRVLDECRAWYKAQPSDQYDGLRVSYLLLYHLTETKNKLSAETKRAREAKVEFDEIRTTLTKELNDVTTQLTDLQKRSESEKELARSVEKTLREHHAAHDARWKAQYDAAIHECRKLRAELNKRCVPVAFTPTEAEFYPENADVPGGEGDDDDEDFKAECNFDRSLPSREDIIFGLSPLPDNMPNLPSSMQPFAAAAAADSDEGDTEDDEESEEDDMDTPYGRSSPAVYPLSHPFTKSGPAPISIPGIPLSPTDTVVSIDGGSSWGSGISKSRPPRYGRRNSHMSSSPSEGGGGDTRSNGPPRDGHQQDKWRAQLHELLDTPVSSSFSSDRFIEPLQRPGSVSRSNTPATALQQGGGGGASNLGSRDAGQGFYEYYRPTSATFGYSKHMDKTTQQQQQQADRREREKLRHSPSIPSALPSSGYGSYRERQHSRSGKNKAYSVPNVSYA